MYIHIYTQRFEYKGQVLNSNLLQSLRHEMDQEGGITKMIWIKTTLFTAGLDGKLRCFDAKAGCCLRSFSGHRAALYDLCISR